MQQQVPFDNKVHGSSLRASAILVCLREFGRQLEAAGVAKHALFFSRARLTLRDFMQGYSEVTREANHTAQNAIIELRRRVEALEGEVAERCGRRPARDAARMHARSQ